MDFQIDKIYNEDCLEGMKRIADGAVDCIITDLPYGTTACAWDSVIPFEPLWEQFCRITKKNAAIVLFGKQPFSSFLIASNIKMFRYELIWEKDKGTDFGKANCKPLNAHENIMLFYRAAPTYNKQMRPGTPYIKRNYCNNGQDDLNFTIDNSGLFVNNGERTPLSYMYFAREPHPVHPTQKPLKLLRYLILTYSNEGDTILDATIGSGTTAVAALMEKRHFIGFETNKEYFDIAQGRINEVLRNPTLF